MRNKWFISLIVILFGVLTQVEATPVFATQYNMKCSSCHSMLPTLNKSGLKFLRNGFRFSKHDKTMAEAFLDANSSESRLLPIRGLVGVNVDSKNRSDVEKVNIYFGGSVTDVLSVYAVTRSTYNKKKNHNLFSESNSRGFLQWNPSDSSHVLKIGWMDPLTMFSNLDRVLMDNALMGSGLLKRAPKSSKKPSWAKNRPVPPAPGPGATEQEKKKYAMMIMPKQPYKLPVPYAGVGLVKGIEYSYLYNEKALFLVNYGIPSSPFFAGDDDSELTVGIELRDIGGYNIGVIYSHQEIGNIKADSYIIPIEKDFFNEQLLLQQSFVYKDSEQYEKPYYGSQTTFTYQVNDESQVRAIISFDQDEAKEYNAGYALTYSRSWEDKYLLHLTGARHKGPVFDESIAKISVYMFL